MKIFMIFMFLWLIFEVVPTPLDDYVWAPDENYKWEYMGSQYDFSGTFGQCNYKGYYINMTSQKWLTDEDFDPSSQAKSIWWHQIIIIVPDQLRFKHNASLYITGGHQNYIRYNDSQDVTLSTVIACSTGSIVGVLFQIPNQYVTFAADPKNMSRDEDAVIAFTWSHFLNNPTQPNWLLRFPMVKASIRAMDTITAFVNQYLPQLGCQLDYYLVAGASKRGWTTWLVGAVDPVRVKAIAPIVLDAINFVAVMHHQYKSYGAWSIELEDYIDENLAVRFDDPNMGLLQQYVDPYFYKDRLAMPKLVVNAMMDEFQQPDDTHYWWKDMPEPKHFLIAPNAEHSMITGILEVVPAIGAFALANFLNQPVPSFSWTIDNDEGLITATVDNNLAIHEVNVWWAYSCGVNQWDNNRTRRDFRLINVDSPCICGPYDSDEQACLNLMSLYDQRTLQPMVVDGKRTYMVSHKDFLPPGDGQWIAYMIDFKFENPYGLNLDVDDLYRRMGKERKMNPKRYFGGLPEDLGGYFEFTTEVTIWPNTFPYQDCNGSNCSNRMV